MAKRSDRWQFYRDRVGKYRWRRKAPNGEVVAAAHQGFKSRRAALANARRCGYYG